MGNAVTPMMEADPLSEWIDIAANVTDFQKLMLIGLMVNQPNLRPAIINETLIMEPENIGSAEKWLRSNLRTLMYFYCKHADRLALESAKTLFDKSDVVKQLATLLIATYSIPVSIAAAFLLWGIGRQMTNWCKKYKVNEFGGQGTYFGSFESGRVTGFIEVTHTPAIEESEQDFEAAPLNVRYIHVLVPEEIKGRIKLRDKETVVKIAQLQQRGDEQNFILEDNQTKATIKGDVTEARGSTEANPEIMLFDIGKFLKS